MQNSKFWYISGKFEKMCLNVAEIASMPQLYIRNESFEPNLTTKFKYLLSKTVRQNPLVGLFLMPKNGPTSEFLRTGLDRRYLNIVVKLGSNDSL